MVYKVEVSYSVVLTYASLEDAERAMEILIEGGITKLELRIVPIEEVAA